MPVLSALNDGLLVLDFRCYAQVLGLSEEQLGLGPHRNFVFVDILEE